MNVTKYREILTNSQYRRLRSRFKVRCLWIALVLFLLALVIAIVANVDVAHFWKLVVLELRFRLFEMGLYLGG